jgi:hypothetical protein
MTIDFDYALRYPWNVLFMAVNSNGKFTDMLDGLDS